MLMLRSLLFDFLFYLSTVIICIFGLPLLLLPLQQRFLILSIWPKVTLFWAKAILGLRYKVIGLENIPKGPYIVASKHQSAWETIALNLVFPQSVFIYKQELGRIPILNLYLLGLKCISVKRGGGGSTVKDMISQAQDVIASGLNIIIFPEGTRTAVGKTRSYRYGISALYDALDVPVVPVALNSGLFWGRRHFLKTGGEITVQVLPPIHPGVEKEAFLSNLQETINSASEQLCDRG
jgi:1-acyl-sn-glycerol-3-phosphate acyltransferase